MEQSESPACSADTRIAQKADSPVFQASEPDRIAALESALRGLVARVRRTGGYADLEDQQALWTAELVLGDAVPAAVDRSTM